MGNWGHEMSGHKKQLPVVVNPGNADISMPAMKTRVEFPRTGAEVFIETAEDEQPEISIARKQIVWRKNGRVLWQVQHSPSVITRAPLQFSERLSKEHVRSKVRERSLTPHFRPEMRAHESRPKLVTPVNRKRRPGRSASVPVLTVDSVHLDFPQILTDAYPWCTIGKVYKGRDLNFGSPEKQGTGVLVGPNLLLTASHVVPWGEPGWYMRFDAASFDGNTLGQSYVATAHGYTSPDEGGDRAHDYALCTLYMPLGNSLGWMGTYGTEDESFYENGQWTTVGYPGDSSRPQVEMLVQVTDADESDEGQEMSTDFVTVPGWSGGPLWAYLDDQPRVVGICSGEGNNFWEWFSGDEHGIFAGGPDMVGLVALAELSQGLSDGIHASDPPLTFG